MFWVFRGKNKVRFVFSICKLLGKLVSECLYDLEYNCKKNRFLKFVIQKNEHFEAQKCFFGNLKMLPLTKT